MLLHIAVAEHRVYALLLFFLSPLFGAPSDATHDFKSVPSPVQFSVLLPLPNGVHSFVSDAGLFSVHRCIQFDDRLGYPAYHGSFEVE